MTERETFRKLENFLWILIQKQILENLEWKFILVNESGYDDDLNAESLSLNLSNKFEISTFSWKSFTISLGFTKSLQSFLLSILFHPWHFLKPILKIRYYENLPRVNLNLSKNLVSKYYVSLSFITQLSLIVESFNFFSPCFGLKNVRPSLLHC